MLGDGTPLTLTAMERRNNIDLHTYRKPDQKRNRSKADRVSRPHLCA